MLNKIRDYLDFADLQYRNPDKAGSRARENAGIAPQKAKRLERLLQNWLKAFSSKSSRMATSTD